VGFSHAIVAVQDLSPEDVAVRLGRVVGAEVTGLAVATTRESPGWCVSPVIDGWTFVVDTTWKILDEDGLARLSVGTRLLASSVEEHTMSFGTTCWVDGAYAWEVIATDGGLFVIGDPPFGAPVGSLDEGPHVVAALDELSGPPREPWEQLGFDGSGLPTTRAAALGLAVREAEDGSYEPAVEVFEHLTGHRYDRSGRLDAAELRVLR
jgi:hypothetical protein